MCKAANGFQSLWLSPKLFFLCFLLFLLDLFLSDTDWSERVDKGGGNDKGQARLSGQSVLDQWCFVLYSPGLVTIMRVMFWSFLNKYMMEVWVGTTESSPLPTPDHVGMVRGWSMVPLGALLSEVKVHSQPASSSLDIRRWDTLSYVCDIQADPVHRSHPSADPSVRLFPGTTAGI